MAVNLIYSLFNSYYFMVKKILFMNGPSQDSSDRFFGWPTPLLYAIAPTIQAIKVGEIDLAYSSKIFDPIWYVEDKNSEKIKQEFRELLKKESTDIICASATYDSLYPTLQLFSEAKRVNPRITTILGGPHFDETHNTITNEIDKNPNLVDFGIAGDGEYSLKSVLEAISKDSLSELDTRNIQGKSWIYHGGKKYATSGRQLDLDQIPFVPIELVDVERHKHDFDIFTDDNNILPTIQMIAQRGCPYRCNFCSERRDLAYPNARSIDSILEEIELRKSQGFKAIFFDDSTFGTYRSQQGDIKQLLKELSKTGIVFGSLNRFNHLKNSELVNLYRKAGFNYLYCSIEQFDDMALQNMTKDQKVKQIESSIKLLKQHDFHLGVSLLYGLPYETEKSIRTTLDFTKQWVDTGTIILVSESVLSYHPGTPAGQGKNLEFNRTPPNQGYPFNRFEEGQWYHPEHVNQKYLETILKLSQDKFEKVMVRNRHSWYAQQGYTLDNKL